MAEKKEGNFLLKITKVNSGSHAARNFLKPDDIIVALDNQLFMILVFSVLFIFKKTRQYMKGFIILNFFISSSIFWYTKVNNLQIIDKTLFKNFIELEDINYSNILLFGSLEIIFYLWSYVSYKTNLSDWIVYKPIKKDILFIMKILFFYLLIAVYYTLLE